MFHISEIQQIAISMSLLIPAMVRYLFFSTVSAMFCGLADLCRIFLAALTFGSDLWDRRISIFQQWVHECKLFSHSFAALARSAPWSCGCCRSLNTTLSILFSYYAALLPRRGPHYASHSVYPSVCLSVRLSVCPSVPLSLPSVTSRHLANYNDTHVLFGTR